MTPDEKLQLQSVILTLADPKGNWQFAWSLLCNLAELNPEAHRPHFKKHPLEKAKEDGKGLS
jgi:hypothetical protein